jgi:hypothetical protein
MTITVASDSATKVELLQDAVVKYTFNTNDPQYDTLNKLINSIDDLTDYTCTLASGADPTMPITFLDAAAAVDIKSAPFLQKALLGSIVYYVNTYLKPSNGTVGYFTAARATGQTTFGTFDTDFVLSTGATNPTVVLQDWRDALEILNTENLDGGYLFPVTTDSSVQSAFIDWSISQYSGRSKTWRMVLGTAAGVTAQQAKDLAFQCNYTRAMVVCQRIQDTNENNVLTDYDPIHYAALMVGGSAGTPITNPLTGKRLNCKGIKDVFSLTTMEDLARFGVTTCFFDRGGAGTSAGFKVLLAVSTDLGEKRMPRIWQDSIAVDHIHNNVLIRMKVFVGQWGDAEKVQQAEMLVATTLDALETARVISRGTDDTGAPLPAYSPPRANLNAGLLSVYWRAYIGGEVDYVGLKGAVDYQTFGLSVAA